MYFSSKALDKVLELGRDIESPTLLDVGCGDCKHSKPFCEEGFRVLGLDIAKPDYTHENFEFNKGFFTDITPSSWEKYDFVWASHVLEHTLNPHEFLVHTKKFLSSSGHLVITVPPLKHQIVGGHVNLFNAGIILYRAVLAGYNCKNAKVCKYGYNISVIIPNESSQVDFNTLNFDNGDIETISKWLPEGYNYQGFNGDIGELNW